MSFKILVPLAEKVKILTPYFKKLMLKFTITSREVVTIMYTTCLIVFYLHNVQMTE